MPPSSSSSPVPMNNNQINTSCQTKTIKCVCIGDGCVGKTSLLISYTTNSFPQSYVPTVFDNYSVTVVINGEPRTLALFDTAGQTGYEVLRTFSYLNTDVFLICFSVMCPTSFHNAFKSWIQEIRQSASSSAPFILVGTKTDLRTNQNELEFLAKSKQKPITREEGEYAAKISGAYGYIECSSLTQENLKETFDLAIFAALTKPKIRKRSGMACCCS